MFMVINAIPEKYFNKIQFITENDDIYSFYLNLVMTDKFDNVAKSE